MGSHMIHRPMSDPGVFSHQAMERDSTGIVAPSGTFYQPVPAGYMDFPKVGVMTFLDPICSTNPLLSFCLCSSSSICESILIVAFPSPQGMPFSVYGNAIIPPVAPITDGTGGPIFNGPHAADPSWNSLIKMVSNSTENNGPQTVIVPFFCTVYFTHDSCLCSSAFGERNLGAEFRRRSQFMCS